MIGKKISVYGGKYFVMFNPTELAVGFRLGQFCMTKRKPDHKNRKKRQYKKILPKKQRIIRYVS